MLSKGSSAVFGRARRQPGRWRTADRRGKGLIKVNGAQTYAISGQVAQTYAISQSISKALVAYYHNCESGSFPQQVDEASKKEIKYILIQFGQPLLIADPGRCESIKSGGPDIRALYQKSYQ